MAQTEAPARKALRYVPLLAILAVFLATVAIVGIGGDFPLNDDWAYAQSVRTLVRTLDWRPSTWAAMTLLTHALWAAPLCSLTDCSYEVLRLTTIIATVILAVVCYVLFSFASDSLIAICAATLLIIFNPIIYEISYTYMTDIFFTLMTSISFYFMLISIRRNSSGALSIATLASVAAVLARQIGLFVPAGYAIARLFSAGSWRRRLVEALVPLAICIASLAAYVAWMRATGRISPSYNNAIGFIFGKLDEGRRLFSVQNFTLAPTYLGLFASPLLLLTKPRENLSLGFRRWTPVAVSALFLVTPLAWFAHRRGFMPLDNIILLSEGLGPLTLRDAHILKIQNVPPLPWPFWAGVTVVALLGQFALVKRMTAYVIGVWDRSQRLTIAAPDRGPMAALAAVVVYLVPVLLAPMFDRYLIPTLPLVFYWILATAGPAGAGWPAKATAGAIFLATGAFAVLGTSDYLAWNRARWAAIAELEQSHKVDYRIMDGGFEYNGERGYHTHYVDDGKKSWWWIEDDKYVLAFGPIEKYSAIARYPYRNLLPPETRAIWVLQRQDAPLPAARSSDSPPLGAVAAPGSR